MKKIFLVCFLFLWAQFLINSVVFADEVIDSKGYIIPCKIETVQEGFVEYNKDGNLYYFTQSKDSPVFNDYVDVRTKLFKKDSIVRYSGKVIIKDVYGTTLQNENGNMNIPWYRVKFVGVYKP